MKTDREFLDGIYQKATLLQQSATVDVGNELSNEIVFRKKAFWSLPSFRVTLVAAAAFMLVVLPGAFLSQVSAKMEIPQGYTLLIPEISHASPNPNTGSDDEETNIASQSQVRLFSARTATPIPGLETADLVCTAKVINIEKSVYDEENSNIRTTVSVKPTQTIKGTPKEKISISVAGGFDTKTRTYQEYETVFEKGEDVMLMLVSSDENLDTYILSSGADSKFTYESGDDEQKAYCNSTGLVLTVEMAQKYIG